MKWILIILLNTQPEMSSSSLAVEFDSQAACELAAAETERQVKDFTRKSKRAIFCVAKGEAKANQ